MNRTELLELHRLSQKKWSDIHSDHPQLAKSLEKDLAERRKKKIEKLFATSTDGVRNAVSRIDIAATAIPELHSVLTAALDNEDISGSERADALSRIERAEETTLFKAPSDHTAVGDIPGINRILSKANIHLVAGMADIKEEATEKIIEAASSLMKINDDILDELVSAGTLRKDEAESLGFNISLFQLTNEDEMLTKTLRETTFPHLGDKKPVSLRDLVPLDAHGWKSFLEQKEIKPPEGVSVDGHAVSLAARTAALFPTDAFVTRLPSIQAPVLNKNLEKLTTLLSANPRVSAVRFETLDLSRVDASRIEELRAAHAETNRLVNAYPGLRLAEVFDHPEMSPADRVREASRRIDMVRQVWAKHDDIELLSLDYTPGSEDIAGLKLDELGFDATRKKMVLDTFKAYQRGYALVGNIDAARFLVENGYASAVDIARSNFDNFRDALKIDEKAARYMYDGARTMLGSISAAFGSILDVWGGGFDTLDVGNLYSGVWDHLREIDGFSELFGSQAMCRCKHCQSIFSPSAYFVDLMTFIEENVRKKFFSGNNDGHVLDPKARRPDLWETVELTCENTNTPIPTLEIINEILENAVARRNGVDDEGLADRTAVRREVYRNILPGKADSFQQPFVLPLMRLETYLSRLDQKRYAIAESLEVSGDAAAGIILGMSRRCYELTTQPVTNLVMLRRLYDINFEIHGGIVKAFDAQRLLKPMGLSREALGALIDTRFMKSIPNSDMAIRLEKTDEDSIQPDIERLRNATTIALDRMHRFVRLLAKTPWSIREMDIVFDAVQVRTLSAAEVRRIADVLVLQEKLGGTVEEICALFAHIPEYSMEIGGVSLFDRLFNAPVELIQHGPFPKPDVRFVHPALREPDAAVQEKDLPRLLAGLRVGDEDLFLFVNYLAAPLGAELDAPNEEDRGFFLSRENLSLLYRHTRLAQLFELDVDAFFQLISFVPGIAARHIDSLEELIEMVRFYQWQRQCGYSLDELGLITGGVVLGEDPGQNAASSIARLIAETATAGTLNFADTVFAVALDITEENSRRIVEANADRFETAASGFRLRPDFDPHTPLILPDEFPVDEPAVRAVLRGYHPEEIVPRYIGGQLGFDADKMRAILDLAGHSPVGVEVSNALRGDGDRTPLENMFRDAVRLGVLLKNDVFDADVVTFIGAHRSIFGVANFSNLTMNDVRAISVMVQFAGGDVEPRFEDELPPAAAEDMQAVLTAFTPGGGFPASVQEALGRVLRAGPGLVVALRENIPLPSKAPAALMKLKSAATYCRNMGIGGDALAAIVQQDYDSLTHAADAILAALQARCTDEKTRSEQLEPIEEELMSRKRDALADYLIHSVHPEFNDREDLYRYFLIDVNMEGCARTSRIVAASSSVQLYIHRILMNLEQDRRDPADPGHIHVTLSKQAAAEWTWRKNYRIWEANRKVFLHPENYAEPDIRDNKTPLFEELESELLQQDIDDQTALDAYAKYMAGFEEVSNLTVAGVYHEVPSGDPDSEEKDILHLFGVTSNDPLQYYYRTVENIHKRNTAIHGAVWSPWRKIDVQIPVRRIAPVVYRGRLYIFWTEIRTQPVNKIVEGESIFSGYDHTMSLKFTSLRLDGAWTAAQSVELPKNEALFSESAGLVHDRLNSEGWPRLDNRAHPEPIDDYTLTGVNWESVHLHPYDTEKPNYLSLVMRNYRSYMGIDLFRRKFVMPSHSYNTDRIHVPLLCAKRDRSLYYGYPENGLDHPNAFASVALDEARIEYFDGEFGDIDDFELKNGLYMERIGRLAGDTDLLSVAGSIQDAIVQVGSDPLLVQGSVFTVDRYRLRRITTTLAETVANILFTHGVDGLLSMDTQRALKEAGLPINIVGSRFQDLTVQGRSDFNGVVDGPMGMYYWEIFFHIPYLIANHLNGIGRYGAAQRWYHYIFDPTATETFSPPEALSAGEAQRRMRDRVWRFIRFRGLDTPRLREILTDEEAIEIYRRDPFNPHAIARMRISAYQKAVVMKYIDNLLDWGDQLFSRFTRESIDEARMIYQMAADILGDRPPVLGECGDGPVTPKTFSSIRRYMDESASSEFLYELETYRVSGSGFLSAKPKVKAVGKYSAVSHMTGITKAIQPDDISLTAGWILPGVIMAEHALPMAEHAVKATKDRTLSSGGIDWKKTQTGAWSSHGAGTKGGVHSVHDAYRLPDHTTRFDFNDRFTGFGWSLVRQVGPAFCVPENKELTAYWDRVEDRIFKINHCMDIEGMKRRLPLFAPEVSPRMLVRAKAAGLSLEDVLSVISGNLPPYRFAYLIDRAKAYAATLQSFGSSLLAALEKRDIEELTRLRLVQQQHLARQNTRLKRWELDVSQEAYDAVNQQLAAALYRKEYYKGLVDEGLSNWERTQQIARHTASGIHIVGASLGFLSAAFSLIPQIGSPFAMKYGGVELGSSGSRFAAAMGTLAAIAENVSVSAGLEAGNDRREQGWKHQGKLAEYDETYLRIQLKAAEIRRDISKEALEIHHQMIEQLEDQDAFYEKKFSNLGLYTWLSATLKRIFRGGYQNALALARLAEQAFRFERGEDGYVGLEATYWESMKGGLLSGERLLLDLQAMERRFIETNYRSLEIDQAFSLTQVDPAALIELRQNSSCEFEIPEFFFDLFYPGHYKRRIKAVRLTIPCLTGPYTNVGATLTLLDSSIRKVAKPGASHLTPVPPQRTVMVSTSTAQNDAGVFELTFRDERYMPFEGAGAVSRWRLELPAAFRQFDYQTINDVIISISYTANADGALRLAVEQQNAAVEGALTHYIKNNPLGRVFSLRNEFSRPLNQLLHSPAGTPVTLTIDDKYFPFFAKGKTMTVEKALLALRTASDRSAAGFKVSVDGTILSGFARDATFGNLFGQSIGGDFARNPRGSHTFKIEAAGDLAPDAPRPGDPSALSEDKIKDIFLYIEYTLS